MTIKYEDQDFDVTDNGDGTFTLTPTAPVSALALRTEYRTLREDVVRLASRRVAHKARLDATIAALTAVKARRDALKLLLETSGDTELDADLTPDP